MIGAIIGDIVGSRFEWHNYRAKDFEFFHSTCKFTDDSVMTLAVAKAILESQEEDYEDLEEKVVADMQQLGRAYPHRGYGGFFYQWLYLEYPMPYNSFGNGAAMRVSPCGFMAKSLDEAKLLSKKVTSVTHNHPEGIKGAEATAVAIFLARSGKNLEEIKQYINDNYYPMDFTLDEIREDYVFNETCQGTVPQALMAFFESKDYEDAIRNAISIGGDSDTIAAITGGIAEAYYGIPDEIKSQGLSFLDDDLRAIVNRFNEKQ